MIDWYYNIIPEDENQPMKDRDGPPSYPVYDFIIEDKPEDPRSKELARANRVILAQRLL